MRHAFFFIVVGLFIAALCLAPNLNQNLSKASASTLGILGESVTVSLDTSVKKLLEQATKKATIQTVKDHVLSVLGKVGKSAEALLPTSSSITTKISSLPLHSSTLISSAKNTLIEELTKRIDVAVQRGSVRLCQELSTHTVTLTALGISVGNSINLCIAAVTKDSTRCEVLAFDGIIDWHEFCIKYTEGESVTNNLEKTLVPTSTSADSKTSTNEEGVKNCT